MGGWEDDEEWGAGGLGDAPRYGEGEGDLAALA